MQRLWWAFAAVLVALFLVLGWIGTRIYQEMPPIPDRVETTDGKVVIASGDIAKGQNVWQTLGSMEVGSVWGHGSYVAPDWTADWLHRETMFVLNEWATAEYSKPYEELDLESRSRLRGRLETVFRTNTYDAASNTVRVDPVRAKAFEALAAHYADVFSKGVTEYSIPTGP